MICSNPVLDQLEEIIRFRDNLFGLCMSCDGGVIVVDHIALAPVSSSLRCGESSDNSGARST
jgi:hypothetical protein